MTPFFETLAQLAPGALAVFAEAALKGTVLLGVAAGIAAVLRQRSAAVRHLVWGCALAGLLLLPVLLALVPEWRVPVPTFVASMRPTRVMEAPATSLHSEQSEPPAALESGAPETPPAPIGSSVDAPARRATTARPLPWQAWWLGLWAAGTILTLSVFVSGHAILRLLARQARPLADREWRDQAFEAARQLGLTIPFALLESPAATLPVTYGLLRPRVLLPAGAGDWPAERRRSVLLHELAHVCRHDCLTQALAQLACAVFWFHPLVWWAASRMRIERERACDDRVLAADTRPSVYADHLLEVVRTLHATRLAALGAVAFARPSQLEGRLLAVLDPRRDRRGITSRLALPSATFASALILPIAAIQFDGVSASHKPSASTVESMRASSVVVMTQAPALAERLAAVESSVSRTPPGDYWMGWEIEVEPSPEGSLLGDTGGLDLSTLDDDSGCFTLDDVITRRSKTTWPVGRSDRRSAVAFLFHAARPGTPTFDRFRFQSTFLPADLGQRPIYWMGTVPDEQSLETLRGFYRRERDLSIRREIIHAIAHHEPSTAVLPLLDEIIRQEETPAIRAEAVRGLGQHPPGNVDRLVSIAKTDRSNLVRRAAAEALGGLKTPQAMDALVALARETNDPGLRREAFDQIGQEVSRGAKSETSTGQGKSMELSGKLTVTKKSTETKTKTKTKTETRTKSDKTAEAEARAKESAVALQASDEEDSGDFEVQRQAVESLGHYPEDQALPRLRELAKSHPSESIRCQAAESISRYGSPAAFEALRDLAWNSPSDAVRVISIECMGRKLPEDKTLPELMAIVRKHPDENARRMAVETMGRISSTRADALLEEVVKGQFETEVQRQAVEMIGRRASSGTLARLKQIALTHPDQEVQRQAVEMIGRRAEPEAAKLLFDIAKNHPNVQVQRQAVESLGYRKDQDVMPMLAEIARTHPQAEVRRQAVETMSRLDPQRALPLLEEILHSKSGTKS